MWLPQHLELDQHTTILRTQRPTHHEGPRKRIIAADRIGSAYIA